MIISHNCHMPICFVSFCLFRFRFHIYPSQLNGSTTAPVASACSSSGGVGGGNKVVVSGSPNNHHIRFETNLSTDDNLTGVAAGSTGSVGGSGSGGASGSGGGASCNVSGIAGGGGSSSPSVGGSGATTNVVKLSHTEQASTSSISFDNTADLQAASGIYIGETGAHLQAYYDNTVQHNFEVWIIYAPYECIRLVC